MKLYQLYKSILEEIKPLEVAWFTTFNLNIDLTERFLIARIGGKQPTELATAEDFEALNQELKNIDIRIWYDYRAMDRSKGKRTTVDMISMDPRRFYNSDSDGILFHPKVIFLSGKGGSYLITGSANLTIAAWSTNKESIVARQITSRSNAQQVVDFFQPLINADSIDRDASAFLKRWSVQFDSRRTDWTFFHSFSKEPSLFDILRNGPLTVWSPYFAKQSTKLLQAIHDRGLTPVSIVPDIMESGKVRITPDELKKIAESPHLSIKATKDEGDRESNVHRLTHAKVWMTNEQLAIGSWNCSFSATGLNTPRHEQNIEAGVVMSLKSDSRQTLLNSLRGLEKDRIQGTDVSEMDQEWTEVLNTFSIDCKIIAHWETFTYSVICSDFTGLTISLPDDPNKKVDLSSVQNKSFKDHYSKVLKNKAFTVFNALGEIVFAGFILEAGKHKRQAYAYTNFFDVFDALIADPTGETHRKMCQYHLDEEEGDRQEAHVLMLNYRGHQSYYMMFVAFQRLYDAIEINADNADKLDMMGFRLPGSLTRIVDLFIETTEPLRRERDEDKLVFYYFLGLEINRCISLFNEYSALPVSLMDIEFLISACQPEEKDKRFIRTLKKTFAYGK